MNNERFLELLKLYFDDNIAADQYQELMQLIREGNYDPELQNGIDALLQSDVKAELDIQRKSAILENILGTGTDKVVPMYRYNVARWVAAAAIVLAATVGIWLYNNSMLSEVEGLTSNSTPEYFHFTGPDFIRLPDSSTVLLTANSSLRYHSSYGSYNREVELTGEGFFDVAHNASKEFRVLTGEVVTTVLGTAFNIDANNKAAVEVTVTRGKVKVADKNRELGIITPNEQIAVNTVDHSFEKKTVVSNKVTEWKDQYFILDNTTMEEAAEILSERYKVSITFTSESMKQCRVTAEFFNQAKLEDVLGVITRIANGTFKEEQPGIIQLDGAGCSAGI